jgi:hypothetical protein
MTPNKLETIRNQCGAGPQFSSRSIDIKDYAMLRVARVSGIAEISGEGGLRHQLWRHLQLLCRAAMAFSASVHERSGGRVVSR